MTISSQQVYAGLSCVGTTSSTRVSGTIQIGTSQRRTELATADVAYGVVANLTKSTNTFTLDVQAGTFSGTAETVATATINPTGADNSILWTAVAGWGGVGNDITVTYAAAVASQATTLCAASGYAITVTPGAKARMTIAGTLYAGPGATNARTFSTLLYAGVTSTKAVFTGADADTVGWDGSKFTLTHHSGGAWTSTDAVATPDLVTTWTGVGGANGTPVVSAAISSAAQAITAGVADAATAFLAVPSASGTVTGAVAAVTATNLTNGTGTIISGNSGYDFEGVAIPSITTLLAINIEVISGTATVTNGTNIFPIPALIYGSTTGTLLTADLVVTATADDTVVNITVLGMD